ncbi:hypothetical protein [Mesoterricola sediminis]|uniref:Uncharacterized protein n=1 Tax=Mesoterricola sediminis TaxID=2927980 RepID=A0AA48GYX2_9BACT|nr:hypothetical protein [Mesoterricola sediminis]BDU78824.1 hypothetical protein METESE_37820 [Mesoterricola sediminis]
MSDLTVAASLDDLERLLGEVMDDPDPVAVETWHTAFKAALAGAERGPQWPGIAARARELGQRLETRTSQLRALRGAIREELLAQEKGGRALRGYKPTT